MAKREDIILLFEVPKSMDGVNKKERYSQQIIPAWNAAFVDWNVKPKVRVEREVDSMLGMGAFIKMVSKWAGIPKSKLIWLVLTIPFEVGADPLKTFLKRNQTDSLDEFLQLSILAYSEGLITPVAYIEYADIYWTEDIVLRKNNNFGNRFNELFADALTAEGILPTIDSYGFIKRDPIV